MSLKESFSNQIEAACICKNSGTTLCDCDPSYVRPQKQPPVTAEQKTICKTYGARELQPIGDLCGCGKVHVEPSTNNRQTSSQTTETRTSIHKLFENSFDRDFAGTKYDFADEEDDDKPVPKKKIADTTSIILAVEEHARCNHHVPEAKLHYGFYGKVKDSFTKRTRQDLKDGYIYRVAGNPISLRRCDKHKQYEDHVEEDESEEEEGAMPYEVGYKELGYGDHEFKERKFTKQQAEEKSYECKEKVHHVHTKTCGCKHVSVQHGIDHLDFGF